MKQNLAFPQDVAEAPLQEITSIPQLVDLFSEWVKVRVSMLNHLKDIPDGSDLVLSDEQDPEESADTEGRILHLTGDTLAAFRLGIQLALEEFSDVPFVSISTYSPGGVSKELAGSDLRPLATNPVH